jgi:hypothetical protein
VYAVLGVLGLAACQTCCALAGVPAVITNPTQESRAELAQAVSRALNGAPVTLADDALTRESTLIVERAAARDRDGRPLTGRQMGRPERFRLMKNGSRCVLVHEGSDHRWTLASVTCSPS